MTSHHPETNGENECLNQTIVTKLRCKVIPSSSKIPLPKLINEILNQHNVAPHSVTKFSPSYLLLHSCQVIFSELF